MPAAIKSRSTLLSSHSSRLAALRPLHYGRRLPPLPTLPRPPPNGRFPFMTGNVEARRRTQRAWREAVSASIARLDPSPFPMSIAIEKFFL